jgi:hypothetical protein
MGIRTGRRRSGMKIRGIMMRSFAAGDYVILYSIGQHDSVVQDDLVLIHYVFHGSRDIESYFHP